jgi:glycine/serine hydroxymethyltransferase
MARIGELIVGAITGRDQPSARERITAEVHDICGRFPVPGLSAA